ncbi:MAG: hypothetical protein KBT67_08475 [bacterium]|nr:hypothetical protein [Candidatus Limimorpha caballi]
MKKLLFIMAAALMTMTQCRKQETMPVTPSANTIKMLVTAGSGAKTDINTETGAIIWSAGDKLYVSDGISWLGSLTLIGEGGSAQGTFTGSIAGIDETETTCHFFYLGHDNGMEEPTGTAAANISLASQDGTLAGAMKYHAGYGRTDVTVESGEYQCYVLMNTKIAIAHINFTTDGTTAYTGSVTMGGTGISNTLSVNPDGTFSGDGTDGITIGGTTGERFVTLIPTAGTDRVDVAFTGDATGSMTFLAGIHENKFYGMKDAIAVTLEAASAPKFSVGENTTVEFAPGNLYWDGSKFHFETSQWATTPTAVGQTGSNGTWSDSHVSHFRWSPIQNVAVSTGSTTISGSTSDVFFTNATQTTASGGFQVDGEEAGTWRTLSKDEWVYLINTRNGNRFANAKVNNVQGLLIFPDGYSGTTSGDGIAAVNSTSAAFPSTDIPSSTWALMESAGVVFLPASGYRNPTFGTYVHEVGSLGTYLSSTSGSSLTAFALDFYSGNVNPQDGNNSRSSGYSVRLVR